MTLQELKSKHNYLRKLDGGGLFKSPSYKVFGSGAHKYRFNSCLTENEFSSFERKHQIKLPADYRSFLLEMGNGGSGPAYGLFPLADWNYELDIADPNYLGTDFPHADKWNISQEYDTDKEDYFDSEEFQKWEEEYYSSQHTTGSMRICHCGCAIYYLLVVSGTEAGHIWVDDRASDNGIYPAVSKTNGQRLTFTSWYDEWLLESIEQLQVGENGR